jgi:hypothetical protein
VGEKQAFVRVILKSVKKNRTARRENTDNLPLTASIYSHTPQIPVVFINAIGRNSIERD